MIVAPHNQIIFDVWKQDPLISRSDIQHSVGISEVRAGNRIGFAKSRSYTTFMALIWKKQDLQRFIVWSWNVRFLSIVTPSDSFQSIFWSWNFGLGKPTFCKMPLRIMHVLILYNFWKCVSIYRTSGPNCQCQCCVR